MIFTQVWIRSVENHRVHGNFENFFTFETRLGSHANKSKDKTKTQHKEIYTTQTYLRP